MGFWVGAVAGILCMIAAATPARVRECAQPRGFSSLGFKWSRGALPPHLLS